MDQWRGIAGTAYKLNKKNSFDFFYRYTHSIDEEEKNIHQIGVAYSFKF
jgi:opacity protein-like surface antigen